MFKLGLKKAEEPEINSPLPAGCPRVQLNSNATYLEIASDSMGFPGGSEGKETACNAGDLGLIPELGRSPREGNALYSAKCSYLLLLVGIQDLSWNDSLFQ